jgi:hypothetical protein
VRTQQDRDEQTVVIAMALGLVVAILLAVGLLAWGAQSLTHRLDGHEDLIVWAAALLAGIVACSYVARSRR